LNGFPQAETWLAAFGDQRCRAFRGTRAVGEIPCAEIAVRFCVNFEGGLGMEFPANPMKLQPMAARGGGATAAGIAANRKSDYGQSISGRNSAVGFPGKVAIHASWHN